MKTHIETKVTDSLAALTTKFNVLEIMSRRDVGARFMLDKKTVIPWLFSQKFVENPEPFLPDLAYEQNNPVLSYKCTRSYQVAAQFLDLLKPPHVKMPVFMQDPNEQVLTDDARSMFGLLVRVEKVIASIATIQSQLLYDMDLTLASMLQIPAEGVAEDTFHYDEDIKKKCGLLKVGMNAVIECSRYMQQERIQKLVNLNVVPQLTLATLEGWVMNVDVVVMCTKVATVRRFMVDCKAAEKRLNGCVPRWESCIADDQLKIQLLERHVYKHKNRTGLPNAANLFKKCLNTLIDC